MENVSYVCARRFQIPIEPAFLYAAAAAAGGGGVVGIRVIY